MRLGGIKRRVLVGEMPVLSSADEEEGGAEEMNLNSFQILVLMALSRLLQGVNNASLGDYALADVIWTCVRNRSIKGSPVDLYDEKYKQLEEARKL